MMSARAHTTWHSAGAMVEWGCLTGKIAEQAADFTYELNTGTPQAAYEKHKPISRSLQHEFLQLLTRFPSISG